MKHYIGYGLALAALALALGAWLRAHDAYKDADSQAKLLSVYLKQKQAEIDAAGEREKKALSDLEAERKKPATVQTVTKLLPMPLPGSVEVQKVNDVPTLTVTGDPQANLNAIRDMEVDCQECKVSLQARETQYSAAIDQLKAAEKDRDNWKAAAKAHSGFWKGLKNDAIKIGIGAAAGYALSRR